VIFYICVRRVFTCAGLVFNFTPRAKGCVNCVCASDYYMDNSHVVCAFHLNFPKEKYIMLLFKHAGFNVIIRCGIYVSSFF
jgi:hypothetical protein